jgi:hypothetical protein
MSDLICSTVNKKNTQIMFPVLDLLFYIFAYLVFWHLSSRSEFFKAVSRLSDLTGEENLAGYWTQTDKIPGHG